MATLVGQKKGKNVEVTTDGQRLIYSASREYLVYDASGSEGEGTLLLTGGLPSINVFYSFDGVPVPLICRSKKAQQWETNNKYWTVSAEFNNEPLSNEQQTGGNEQDPQDPTTWYAIVNFDFETYEQPFPYLYNFAKRPYSSVPTVEALMPVLKFTQYLPPSLTIYDLISDYHEVLNDGVFLNAETGYWKLSIADADYGVTNGYECWMVDFELRFKKAKYFTSSVRTIAGTVIPPDTDSDGSSMYPGWFLYIPQLDTLDINKAPFTDVKENNGDVGKLDTDGTFLADQTQEPYVIQHGLYKTKNFSFIRIRQGTA